MKLCSFTHKGKPGYGLVTNAGIIDLGQQLADLPTLKHFIKADAYAKAASLSCNKVDYSLDDVTLQPVIPNPDKIICVGLNYHDHVQETGHTVTKYPTLFPRYQGSQVGHGSPMIKPLESDKFDYEGEMAVIIGKAGRRISKENALDHIAVYSCYNDGSIRDWQSHTTQFMPGKTFAATGGFGPWMVTADEIPDPSVLSLITRLNGAVVQQTTTDLMITDIPALIAYCSTILPLLPGDVIVTGTPGGVGFKRNPPLWMKDGDTVDVEISGIGILSNPVVAEK